MIWSDFLEIKSLIEKGFNIKGIKQIIKDDQDHLTDDEQETRKQMIVEATQKPQREAPDKPEIYHALSNKIMGTFTMPKRSFTKEDIHKFAKEENVRYLRLHH